MNKVIASFAAFVVPWPWSWHEEDKSLATRVLLELNDVQQNIDTLGRELDGALGTGACNESGAQRAAAQGLRDRLRELLSRTQDCALALTAIRGLSAQLAEEPDAQGQRVEVFMTAECFLDRIAHELGQAMNQLDRKPTCSFEDLAGALETVQQHVRSICDLLVRRHSISIDA